MATTPVKSPWGTAGQIAAPGVISRPQRKVHQLIARGAHTRVVAVHSGLRAWIAEEENQLLVYCAAFIGVTVLALWSGGRKGK
jgi:hypothetical protein